MPIIYPARCSISRTKQVERGIKINRMYPIFQEEDKYDYSTNPDRGFVSFTLEEPAIGFGEKRYRQLLFTEQMQKSVFE